MYLIAARLRHYIWSLTGVGASMAIVTELEPPILTLLLDLQRRECTELDTKASTCMSLLALERLFSHLKTSCETTIARKVF